jgi:hypothetical protein
MLKDEHEIGPSHCFVEEIGDGRVLQRLRAVFFLDDFFVGREPVSSHRHPPQFVRFQNVERHLSNLEMLAMLGARGSLPDVRSSSPFIVRRRSRGLLPRLHLKPWAFDDAAFHLPLPHYRNTVFKVFLPKTRQRTATLMSR